MNSRSEADRPIHRSPDLRTANVFARRVAFVSDSFGVTERFVAFAYARDALSRATLDGTITASQLQSYIDVRRAFIRYSFAVPHRWPLAFYPINYDDWLKNDPAFAASFALAKREKLYRARSDIRQSGNADTLKSESAAAKQARRTDAPNFSVSDFQRFSVSPAPDGRWREVLPNGSLEGPLVRGRRIAGLAYGIDVPAPWVSKVEPTEAHLGVVWRPAARTGGQGLRISGATNDEVFQWVSAAPGALYSASVAVRGRVSTSGVVLLTLGWLDAKGRYLGRAELMRLPDGTWPQWVTLRQGGHAPANAAWVGIGIRVQSQQPGDWVEADDFSLRVAE